MGRSRQAPARCRQKTRGTVREDTADKDANLIYRGSGEPHDGIRHLAEPPPWRQFNESARADRGAKFRPDKKTVEIVNAALYLRRPLLVTGKPGTGKSSLAYAVAHELQLGPVLLWSITTRSTLQHGLYSYDAIARLHDVSLAKKEKGDEGAGDGPPQIGRYIRLGPLGTAMLPARPDPGAVARPRVLLIDELDKSDIDLPNDLLNIFEEGEFDITELLRLPEAERLRDEGVFTSDGEERVRLVNGRLRCTVFPFVVMTSNGEREFPPAFLRRCLRLDLEPHSPDVLARIVEDRLAPTPEARRAVDALVKEFVELRDNEELELSADQLLNAVYLVMQGLDPLSRDDLRQAIFRSLSDSR